MIANESGSTSWATHTGTPANDSPELRSTSTRPIPARHKSVATPAAIAAATIAAARRQRPSGIMVPVASESRRPSRAAIPAPRKPTHSVRCWTNAPEPGMPALKAVRHTISASGSSAISASARLAAKPSIRAGRERGAAEPAGGVALVRARKALRSRSPMSRISGIGIALRSDFAKLSASARHWAVATGETFVTLSPRRAISPIAVVSCRGTSVMSLTSAAWQAVSSFAWSAGAIFPHACLVMTSPPTSGASPMPTMLGVERYHWRVSASSGVVG